MRWGGDLSAEKGIMGKRENMCYSEAKHKLNEFGQWEEQMEVWEKKGWERKTDGENGRRQGGSGEGGWKAPCGLSRGTNGCGVVRQKVRTACMYKLEDACAPWDLHWMQVEWCRARNAGGWGGGGEGGSGRDAEVMGTGGETAGVEVVANKNVLVGALVDRIMRDMVMLNDPNGHLCGK